jgi:uncharacterized alpha/beta hydrolase family protein
MSGIEIIIVVGSVLIVTGAVGTIIKFAKNIKSCKSICCSCENDVQAQARDPVPAINVADTASQAISIAQMFKNLTPRRKNSIKASQQATTSSGEVELSNSALTTQSV